MNKLLGLLCIAVVIKGYYQQSTPASDRYTAAVVEYNRGEVGATPNERVDNRITDYINFLLLPAATPADIVVYPEGTLNDAVTPQSVPDPSLSIVMCANVLYTDNIMQRLSCAARDHQKYLVVNVIIQMNCAEEREATGDDRECTEDNLNLYNSNVVFNRIGAVISVYRKSNVFLEQSITTPFTPDANTFPTAFGVTFGHLIGFDILYEEPILSSLEGNVQNFVYSTMWYSELPFLTAVQLQQSWAYKHNVNLLAAGANNPIQGITGTGIYSGRDGALLSNVATVSGSNIWVHEIRKIPGTNTDIIRQNLPSITPPITLLRDNLELHQHIALISTIATEQNENLCHNEFCCHFTYQFDTIVDVPATVAYSYIAAVFYGNRTYNGNAEATVYSCAIIACTNNLQLGTCGTVFLASAGTVDHRNKFTKIDITGTFPSEQTQIMPTTLGINLYPFESAFYQYIETETYEDEQILYRNITISLQGVTEPQHLLTFGIFGAEFPSGAATNTIAIVLILVSLLNIFI